MAHRHKPSRRSESQNTEQDDGFMHLMTGVKLAVRQAAQTFAYMDQTRLSKGEEACVRRMRNWTFKHLRNLVLDRVDSFAQSSAFVAPRDRRPRDGLPR